MQNLLYDPKISSTFAPDFKNTMYRVPEAYIADVEVMTGKSNRTARRIMAKIRKHFGLDAYQRPTLEQVQQYLRSAV